MHKIVLISSGQPSLNPRLVKEADALANNGYQVTVLYAYWNEWGTAFDKELIADKKWAAIRIGGDPNDHKTTYFISRLIHKIAKIINKFTKGHYLGELAIARSSYFLIKEAKKYPGDMYIGHNLGAIAATVKAARYNKAYCGFDAEDFHRNELSNDTHNQDVILKAKIEELYIPLVDYLTASSQNIGKAYQHLFPEKSPVIIRNVFPKNIAVRQPIIKLKGPVKLFWFSQTIGSDRGLEIAIEAFKRLENYPFELHLLGHIDDITKNKILESLTRKHKEVIHFYKPIPSGDIINFSSQFDIGLAIETGAPMNRDICLTNKIFTYIQAGLCIVASNTTAQCQLMEQYPTIGKTFNKTDPKSLADVLFYYYQNREILFETRKAALKFAHEELNWENESRKFLAQVKQILNYN